MHECDGALTKRPRNVLSSRKVIMQGTLEARSTKDEQRRIKSFEFGLSSLTMSLLNSLPFPLMSSVTPQSKGLRIDDK